MMIRNVRNWNSKSLNQLLNCRKLIRKPVTNRFKRGRNYSFASYKIQSLLSITIFKTVIKNAFTKTNHLLKINWHPTNLLEYSSSTRNNQTSLKRQLGHSSSRCIFLFPLTFILSILHHFGNLGELIIKEVVILLEDVEINHVI